MAAAAALITLEPAAVDEPMFVALAARATEAIGPANLLQGGLILLLGAVEPLELKQGKTLLELNAAVRRNLAGICLPFFGSDLSFAELAG